MQISTKVCNCPAPIPGHGVTRFTFSQICSLSRFSDQNGQVRHCVGRDSYTLHNPLPGTFVRSRNTQSNPRRPPLIPTLTSFNDQRVPSFRAYFSRNTASGRPNRSASARDSSSLIHTAPGGPEQQFPHDVHSNRKPSAYHSLTSRAPEVRVVVVLLLPMGPPPPHAPPRGGVQAQGVEGLAVDHRMQLGRRSTRSRMPTRSDQATHQRATLPLARGSPL